MHATGLPAPNRSHFSAMEELEDADPGSSKRVGWLNRLVGTRNHHTPLQGVGMLSGPAPTELVGPIPLMTVGSVDDMSIAGDDQYDTDPPGKRRRSLGTLWDDDTSVLGKAMRSTLQATSDSGAGEGHGRQHRVVRRLGPRQGPVRGGPRHSRATSASRC